MPYVEATLGAPATDADVIAGFTAAVKRGGGVPTRMPNGPNRGKLGARFLAAKPAKGKPARWNYLVAPADVLAADARENARLARDVARGSTNARAALSVAEGAARRIARNSPEGLMSRAVNAGFRAGQTAATKGAAAGARQFTGDVAAAAKREAGYVATDAANAAKAAGQAAQYAADKGKELAKDAIELPRKTLAAALGLPDWAIPALAVGAGYMVLSAYLPNRGRR